MQEIPVPARALDFKIFPGENFPQTTLTYLNTECALKRLFKGYGNIN
jgi:hypothetical protein